MKKYFIFLVLLKAKIFARLFYRFAVRRVGEVPSDPWDHLRLIVFLNHTSLFEWLYTGMLPIKMLWRIAGHGVVPAADKTLKRPIVGKFFSLLAQHVVPITRRPDETWRQVLVRIDDPESMMLILPEGRMKRADGLDSHGRPMSVRGGVADIIRGIDEGRILFGYAGGLHHVQVPGQHLPRLFKRLEMTLEVMDLQHYQAAIDANKDSRTFKAAVKRDLERRKERWCRPFNVTTTDTPAANSNL